MYVYHISFIQSSAEGHLETTTLSEISQTVKAENQVIPFMWLQN